MDPTNIQKSALGNLIKLGKGGQGTVFKAPRAQLTLQGKAFFGEAVYKEYHSDKLNDIEVSVLREMVAFLATLPFADGANLVARAAWPVCLVEEGSEIVGFLMPCVPSPFTINFRLPSGVSQQLNAEFQHLLNDDKFLSDHGITLTDRDRYALLYELAASLDLFHGHKIAVGDLSPKNVLFSLSPKPSVYFIDCDSMKFRGKAVLPQVETPSWDIRTISSSQDLATPQTDRYKFGLFVLRLFSGDQTTRDDSRLPSNVPDVVRSMVERSLSPNAQYRPEMREWLKPLKEAERSAAKVQTPLPSAGTQSGTQTAKPPAPTQRPATSVISPALFWLPLLLLAVFIAHQLSNQEKSEVNRLPTQEEQAKEISPVSEVCTLSANTKDGMGTVYSAGDGDRIRADLKIHKPDHILVNSKIAYLWTDSKNKGMKFGVKALPLKEFPSITNFECQKWTPDNSIFVPPTNIDFINTTKEMLRRRDAESQAVAVLTVYLTSYFENRHKP